MTGAAWTDSVAFGLFLVLGAYAAAARLQRRVGGSPLLHPVLVASGALAVGLHVSGVPAGHFRRGADFVHLLLGPATVALAVPLHRQISRVRRSLWSVLGAVFAGAVTAAASAAGIARLLGASRVTSLSLAPKSVTTPIAMAVADSIGGDPGIAVLCVTTTGILGAMLGAGFFRMLRIRDPRAIGLGFGTAAHGVGTSRALELGETEGAFSSLAMGLTGLVTAVLLPWFARLFG